jgi:hypothetical protein
VRKQTRFLKYITHWPLVRCKKERCGLPTLAFHHQFSALRFLQTRYTAQQSSFARARATKYGGNTAARQRYINVQIEILIA